MIPATPGGSVTLTPLICWLESGRLIVSENGVKAPACLFDEPPSKEGASWRGLVGHASPLGPVLIVKLPVGFAGAPPDHGVKVEVVV